MKLNKESLAYLCKAACGTAAECAVIVNDARVMLFVVQSLSTVEGLITIGNLLSDPENAERVLSFNVVPRVTEVLSAASS